MAYTDKMDSVFDQNTDDELDFDVMFDEDDALIDTVAGLNEDGTPLTGDEFADVHLSDGEPSDVPANTDSLDDKTTVDDVKDALEDKDTISGKNVENGSEQDFDDDNEIKDAKGDDLAWFEDEDDNYQDNDFSKGEVDPEKINKSIEGLEECDLEASEDVAGKTSDDLDIECEDDTEERKDDYSSDDGVGEFEGDTDLEPAKEASAFLEGDDDLNDEEDAFDSSLDESDEDLIEDNPNAPESLDDFDLPNDVDEDQIDITSEAADDDDDHGLDLDLPLEEDGEELDNGPKNDTTQSPPAADTSDSDNIDQGSDVSEASAFLEGEDDMLTDDQEAEAHKNVQCDGTDSCQCPACKAARSEDNTDPSFELSVGDLAEAADLDVEEVVDDELDASDPDLGDIEGEEPVEGEDLSYDTSDEDLIDIALSDDDDLD